MKISVTKMMVAFVTLVGVINAPRELPQKAKYRLGRLYDAISKEYERASTSREELIKQFGEEILEDGKPTGRWQVPETSEKHKDFVAAWSPIGDSEIEVSVQPIPLSSLGDSTKGIEIHELLALDAFITDDQQ